jgi:hypothetical protein
MDEQRTIVKKSADGFAVFYSDGTILVRHVRLSYPNVLLPYEGKNDDGEKTSRYSVVGLLPKDTHKAAALEISALIKKMIADESLDGVGTERRFLRDGDNSGKAAYEGYYTVSAGETRKPEVRGPRKEVYTEKDAAKIYGGCFGNILIRPWVQKNRKYGNRINAGLTAVQFVRDGEPFGETKRISAAAIDATFEDEASGWEAPADEEI